LKEKEELVNNLSTELPEEEEKKESKKKPP